MRRDDHRVGIRTSARADAERRSQSSRSVAVVQRQIRARDHRRRLRHSGSGAAFEIGPGTVSAMSDSPLSDVMSEHAATRSPESYERFLALFRACTVGIVASGTPVTDASGRLVAGWRPGRGPDYSR